MSFPYRDENNELNDETRRSPDGSYIQLPEGITHYEIAGDRNGEPVNLIHGFSVPYFIYDPTFEFLSSPVHLIFSRTFNILPGCGERCPSGTM